MRNSNIIAKSILCSIVLTLIASCAKTKIEKEYVVQTVEVPVVAETTGEIIQVPKIVLIDKSVGTQSIPVEISKASEDIQKLGQAVAKVFSVTGSSGTGFFISEDGLFLTNEHVIPITDCVNKKCNGYKIVTGLGTPTVKEYTDFQVLAQDGADYDFTLLKVNLAANETVSYLDLSLQYINLQNENDINHFIVLGHPGGASLQYASALPSDYSEVNLEFKALVIPGNSGGPLVNVKNGKVYGLVKSMRTAATIQNETSTFYENTNQSTSIRELNELIKKHTGTDLLEVSTTTDMKILNKTTVHNIQPDEEIFMSALYRKSSDVRGQLALTEILKYIGTEYETEVLELMLTASNKYNQLNFNFLDKILDISLALGRPLKWSDENFEKIKAQISFVQEHTSQLRIQIKFSYFDNEQRKSLQKQCLSMLPLYPEHSILFPYMCLSTKRSDGLSVIGVYADWLLKNRKVISLENSGEVLGFLMMVAALGIDSQEDKNNIHAINQHLRTHLKDIHIIMSNDSLASGLINEVLGIGRFAETF